MSLLLEELLQCVDGGAVNLTVEGVRVVELTAIVQRGVGLVADTHRHLKNEYEDERKGLVTLPFHLQQTTSISDKITLSQQMQIKQSLQHTWVLFLANCTSLWLFSMRVTLPIIKSKLGTHRVVPIRSVPAK